MVIGIDSYHDSAKKGRSVGGVVASINPALTRYYSRCTFQHSMQELSDGLEVCMKGWHFISWAVVHMFSWIFSSLRKVTINHYSEDNLLH